MAYYFNPKSFGAVFSLPSSIVDECIKLATATQLKVALYIYRNSASGIDVTEISQKLGISSNDVEDALVFWKQREILCDDSLDNLKEKNLKKVATEKNEKPSRKDVVTRGLEDSNIALILRDAQIKFGRNLKTNESSALVYFYDDLGLDVTVILFLLQYAVSLGKMNVRFLEKTAVRWANEDVSSVADAESLISSDIKAELSWKRVLNCFGIEKRKPSEKELSCAKLWFDEWALDDEVLTLAYNVCVDTKSKFLFGYTAKIIENWKKDGLVKAESIKEYLASGSNSKISNDYAAYDLDLYEKMIDSEDK